MTKVISAALILTAIIHLLPVTGLLGPQRLEVLYGIRLQDPNLVILLRHRAVLFGLLGVFLLASAFRPAWQLNRIAGGIGQRGVFFGAGIDARYLQCGHLSCGNGRHCGAG